MLSGEMSKNKKILFSGIFLAAIVAISLVVPTKTAHANFVTDAFYYFIYAIFLVISNLLNVAGILFDWAVDPQTFKDVLDTQAVYNGWQMVRDFFNIAFILVLLFSAFSTIFQVEKYHIKNILLNLVIIALLVNFSYPIARVVIDASNVVMYYLLNMAFPDNGGTSMISASWAHWTDVTDNMVPRDGNGSLNTDATDLFKKLILAMIMVFVLMATIITMGILLVVRIVVLAILVILAPAAFIAGILPSTKNYSEDWWKNLFKYSFMGPTLAFMIVIGLKMMAEMNLDKSLASVKKLVSSNVSNTGDPDLISKLVFFSIPIVIMWSGMIVAQKLGVAGAGFAVKMGQGAAKKFSGFNFVKKNFDDFRKVRAERKEDARWKPGKWLGEKANDAQDAAVTKVGITKKQRDKAQRRKDKRRDDKRRKEMDEKAKEIEDTKTIHDMATEANSVFDAVGNIKPNVKITDVHAGSAKAYTSKNSDEKKDFIANQLAGKGTIPVSSPLRNILGGVTPSNATLASREEKALFEVLNNPNPSESDLRTIATLVGNQAEKIKKSYVKT